MRNLSNQKHRDRDPDNNNIRLHYYEALKQYRNTVRRKRDQHVRNKINQIEESTQNISGKIGTHLTNKNGKN